MGDASRWVMGQLHAMEAALKVLVETNSYTDNVEGGGRWAGWWTSCSRYQGSRSRW